MRIEEIAPGAAPMELLLDADPSAKVRAYLPQSRCFVAREHGAPVGVYVIRAIAADAYELMNIAVTPALQRQGIGTALLQHAIAMVRELGARRLEVGTGTFGHYLAYYQRQGFRVRAVVRDFFLDHYSEPLFENGIRHRDMLRLALDYPQHGVAPGAALGAAARYLVVETTPMPVSDLATLLATMEPVLLPGTYVYASLPDGARLPAADMIASIREPEGLSVVVSEDAAARHGLAAQFRCAWIMLNVNSDLQAVGLTAAFATALGDAGISCNVVAGANHDHIFVPLESAPRAIAALRALQESSRMQARR